MSAQEPKIICRGGKPVIIIPMNLKRKEGRKEIIIPEGIDGSAKKSLIQKPLVIAIARAHAWKEALENGNFSTIQDIANTLGVDSSYVGRILRLTLLSPDIIQTLLTGHEPSGVSLEKLTKNLPLLWSEQNTVQTIKRFLKS